MADGIDWEGVARSETHPTRMSILELLSMDGGRTLSTKEISFELQTTLNQVRHHTKELRTARLVRLAHKHEVGGAVEYFYRLSSISGRR